MGNCCRKKNVTPVGQGGGAGANPRASKRKDKDGNPVPTEGVDPGTSQKTTKKGVSRKRRSAGPGGNSEKLNKDTSKKGTVEIPQDEINEGYAAPGPGILPKMDVSKELGSAAGPNSDAMFPAASLKKEVPSVDKSAEKMSLDNTLKEVPKRMPETDIIHDKESIAQIFTNDQLL